MEKRKNQLLACTKMFCFVVTQENSQAHYYIPSLLSVFFSLYHLLYSFLHSQVHFDVGVGDNLVKKHTGARVFASSLVQENILRY